MRLNRVVSLCLSLLLLAAVPTSAQEFRGRINGIVTDNTGAVLPGVTVTARARRLIQPQVQVTGADGDYRLIALPPGVYDLTFELSGFQTIKREGIRVVINTTLTVDQQLQVATLQETVTVTGESPVVDTSTTTVGTNFTKELLTEIPNARDIWAAMAQAPGFQMTGYDVGGSHTGTQTGYMAYGVSQQHTTRIEGINTTEGTDANAGYFDFGSFEEFQLGGAGNMADQDAAGGVAEHHRQVGRRPVHGQLVQRLGRRRDDQRQRARTRSGSANQRRRETVSSSAAPLDARQPDRPAVRHQRQRRRPALEGQGVVLLLVSPERPVQVRAELRRARALEAEQPVHVQGHVPAESRTTSSSAI